MLAKKLQKLLKHTSTLAKNHEIPLILLSGAWFAFFSRTILGMQVYFLDDLKIIYYPLEYIYAQFQSHLQLPLWSQYFGFGQPLLAWGQLGFFTPIHVILRIFQIHPLALLQISILSYFFLGLLGTYIFFIIRKFSQSAATLAAFLFVFTGFSVGHLNHVNFYTATMVLPWLLIAIHYFLKKPTLQRSAAMAILAAIIPLSGQPQVSLYTLIIAAGVGTAILLGKPKKILKNPKYWSKTIILTILAASLAIGIASLSILPLMEFLPQSDRASGVDPLELYEFSYVPSHAITLLMPYFFGGHNNYWGAKGFQELAAYTGILPLLLAGVALTNWRKYRTERIIGIFFVTSGILLALAKFSPLYRWLVEQHIITSLSVPGRFVYFFLFGITLLAAVGLQDFLGQTKEKTNNKKAFSLIIGCVLSAALFIPFIQASNQNVRIQNRLHEIWSVANPDMWLIAIGLLTLPFLLILSRKKYKNIYNWAIPTIVAITLIAYGWNYNPMTPTSEAFTNSPFIETLKEFGNQDQKFSRLYSNESLLLTGAAGQELLSEPISPLFTVHQPITFDQANSNCVQVIIHAEKEDPSTIKVTISKSINEGIIQEYEVKASDIASEPKQDFCINSTKTTNNQVIISFSSDQDSGVRLLTTPEGNPDQYIYFVRVQNPTPEQIVRSRKPFTPKTVLQNQSEVDLEARLLARHLNVLANTSSARWISALSIKPYREFVDTFFVNDTDEVIDGEGIHTLTRNRRLLNMAGVTHLAQSLKYDQETDPVIEAGYNLTQEQDTGRQLIRLYENPESYPKVFFSEHASFVPPADETRFFLRDPNYDPKKLVYLSGPVPPNIPENPPTTPLEASATITRYDPTFVEITTQTNQESYLVFTDATTEQWKTYIDGERTPRLVANSIFKAAQIPAGNHTITFKYESAATNIAKNTSSLALVIVLILLISPWQILKRKIT